MQTKYILFGICAVLFLLGFSLNAKSPDCPFHVDYIQYTKDIGNFYENHIISSGVNGKYLYVYFMAILIKPLYNVGFGIYDSMVLISLIFQIILVILFYRYTNSLLKTLLMASTLTFLTFIGSPETVFLSSIFLMLYFINRDRPYSEFFIAMASLIRLDSAIFYLFARKKTAVLPIAITALQWLATPRYFPVHSDFGINSHPVSAFYVFILSFGFYILLFAFVKPSKSSRLDQATLGAIALFLILFLKFPSQKIFFFPVMLSFMLYDFDFSKLSSRKLYGLLILLVAANLLFGIATQYYRAGTCTPKEFYTFASGHNESIFFGVFQPYLDYKGKQYSPPYQYQITINCRNLTDYMIAEDWRNAQLMFQPYKFCLEPWDGRYS